MSSRDLVTVNVVLDRRQCAINRVDDGASYGAASDHAVVSASLSVSDIMYD